MVPRPQHSSTRLWPWLSILLVTGILLLGVVSYVTWNWLHNVSVSFSSNPVHAQTATLQVNRTVSYADLSLTVLSVQYAASFSDDFIHPGPAVVRLNMQVTNKTRASIAVVYYDIARLLAPKQPPVLNETLVVVPFSGAFHPEQYLNQLSPQTLTIYYNFKGYTLAYNLMSVDARYSYNGVQVKAGQQYYVLNWSVDNTNGSDVSPGYGFDYMRLIVNGADRPPIDNTLPNIFKAGSKGVGGRVVFIASAGMTIVSIAFLLQLSPGQDTYQVNL